MATIKQLEKQIADMEEEVSKHHSSGDTVLRGLWQGRLQAARQKLGIFMAQHATAGKLR